MLGVVNLDKPVGPTSHDMVGLMRRLTGTRRIGHAGTLDPLASGVLPILVGPATRFSEELTGGSKSYEATVRLGQRSATDDAEGPIEPTGQPLPDEAAIAAGLRHFVGTFGQRPPAFSARKLAGRTAHRAARAGEPIDLPARQVTVTKLDLRGVEHRADVVDAHVELVCGAGTYVRSIARDLGELLGCGAYLAALRRTAAAGLRVDDAVTPARLEELSDSGRLSEVLLPVGELLPLPRLTLDDDAAWRFAHGATLQLSEAHSNEGRHAVFGPSALLGVGTLEAGVLRPEKVIAPEPPSA
ncbi:MAG: tRNA pseudouridine(55) synthase TruB [Candidatus Limnocylindria bacterium]